MTWAVLDVNPVALRESCAKRAGARIQRFTHAARFTHEGELAQVPLPLLAIYNSCYY